MKYLFLLGAGASKDAGIPDSNGMSKEIARLVNSPRPPRDFVYDPLGDREVAKAVNFVAGGLMKRSGQNNINPFEAGVDVEDLFNSVMFLAERATSDIEPFVGNWDPAIELIDRPRDFNPDWNRLLRQLVDTAVKESLEKVEALLRIRNSRTSKSDLSRIGNTFNAAFESRRKLSAHGDVFRRTAEKMKSLLAQIVWLDDSSKVGYLEPLLDSEMFGDPINIATLNYDNTIELAASNLDRRVQVGVDTLDEDGNISFDGSGIHYLKLHGSVNWILKRIKNGLRALEVKQVDVQDAFKPSSSDPTYYSNPGVIFGERNKLTTDGPFLDLLQLFRQRLSESTHLVIIGFSFRDPHINTYIARWINASTSNKLTVIDPGFTTSKQEFAKSLRSIGPSGEDSRLHVIEETAASGIQVFIESIRAQFH